MNIIGRYLNHFKSSPSLNDFFLNFTVNQIPAKVPSIPIITAVSIIKTLLFMVKVEIKIAIKENKSVKLFIMDKGTPIFYVPNVKLNMGIYTALFTVFPTPNKRNPYNGSISIINIKEMVVIKRETI